MRPRRSAPPWAVVLATLLGIVVGFIAGGFVGGAICEAQGECGFEGIGYFLVGGLSGSVVGVLILVRIVVRGSRPTAPSEGSDQPPASPQRGRSLSARELWQLPGTSAFITVLVVIGVGAAWVGYESIPHEEPATCEYKPDAKALLVTSPLEIGIPELSVESGVIMMREGDPPGWSPKSPCGAATTTNTDTIYVQGPDGGHAEVYLDQGGGAFAPGATEEPTGISEIEIKLTHGSVYVSGTDAQNVTRVGTLGANLNEDEDVDVTAVHGPIYVSGA